MVIALHVPMTTTFERVARIDEVSRTKGWNMRIVAELAAELGVSRKAVYGYRNMAAAWTQRAMKPCDIDKWRAEEVQLLSEAAIEARAKGDYASVARLVETQAKIIGTIAPVKIDAKLTLQAAQVPMVVDPATKEPRALTTDEIDAELNRLEARRSAIETTSVPIVATPRAHDDEMP